MDKNTKHHVLAAVAKEKQKIIPSAYEAGWVQHQPGLLRGREIHSASGNRHLEGGTERAAAALISRLPGHFRDL